MIFYCVMASLQRFMKPVHPLGAEIVDAQMVITPGLVNTHHHLYQSLTQSCARAGCVVVWVAVNPLSDMGGFLSRRDARFRDAGAKRTCPVWLHDEFGSFVPIPKRRTS